MVQNQLLAKTASQIQLQKLQVEQKVSFEVFLDNSDKNINEHKFVSQILFIKIQKKC